VSLLADGAMMMNIFRNDAKEHRPTSSPLLTIVAATALTSVVGLAGCGADAQVDQPAVEESVEHAEDGAALELSDRVYLVGEVSQYLTPDGSRVVVGEDAPAVLTERVEGDILVVGDFVQGRWQLIEAVERDERGRLVFLTRQALLTEVVRSGTLGIVMEASEGRTQARVEGVSSLQTRRRTQALNGDESASGIGSLSVDADISEWSGAQIDTTALVLSATGHLKTEPTVKIGFELEDYEIVETTVWAAGNHDLDVGLDFEFHPDSSAGGIGPAEINQRIALCPRNETDCKFTVELLGSRFIVRPEARISYRYLGDGEGALRTGYKTGSSNYLKAGFRHRDDNLEIIRDFEGFDVETGEMGSPVQDNDVTLKFEMQLDVSYTASIEPASAQPWWQTPSDPIQQGLTVSQALEDSSGGNVLPSQQFEITPFSGFYKLDGSVAPPACGVEQTLTLRGHAVRNTNAIPVYERNLLQRTDNLIQTDQRLWDDTMTSPICDELSWCAVDRSDTSAPAFCQGWYPDVDSNNYSSLAIINCQVDQCAHLDSNTRVGQACETCEARLCDSVEIPGVLGCELQPDLCESGSDCAGWEMCAFNKQCIRETPLRVTVTWAAPVDLELYAFDQDGNELFELTGTAYDSAPDGWIAARSVGDDPIGAPYFEAAVYAFADINEPLRFFVENKTQVDDDSEIAYTLRIDHASGDGFDGFIRQYDGTLADIAGETSIGYVYHSEVDIEHCYKVDPATDTQTVCASGAASGVSQGLN
jgi:hypothetical protein